MLRIRKQFGIGWYVLIIGMYVFEVPVFAFCLLFDKVINAGNTKYSWQNLKGYTANIAVLLKYFFRILQNKTYFYKVA